MNAASPRGMCFVTYVFKLRCMYVKIVACTFHARSGGSIVGAMKLNGRPEDHSEDDPEFGLVEYRATVYIIQPGCNLQPVAGRIL